ncbi:MAG: recombinase family protein [Oscillospiraceae bacterium]|nr:recombinase family protein [Oscillospiraceae bacterium]
MSGDTYALIRVSTEEQNETRQLIEMTKLGINEKNIIIEKESGKSPVRNKYKSLVKRLKTGDTLYIENIDRLGRDYNGILEQWNILTKQKGIIVKFLDTPLLDTDQTSNDLLSRFMRDILLMIQAFQSEYEWQKIKTRQAQGIAVAKASGKLLGRPKKEPTAEKIKVVRQYQNKDITLDDALSLLNIKKTAFYKLCNDIKNL